MMKNIKKAMVIAAAFAAVTLVGIGSTANKADAKKKFNRLTAKCPVSLTAKESKKYCKAGKIKFVYNTEKNKFKLTSFKKNKYAPVSKKVFLKNLGINDFCWIDGKKYGSSIEHKDVKGDDCWGDGLADGGVLGFENTAEGLSKALTPGKHKVKVEFCFAGDKKGRYYKIFFWTGTINIKEAYNVSGYNPKISHVEYREDGLLENVKTSVFSITNILANADCKLNINVKYVFDKNHIGNRKHFDQGVKRSRLTEDELINNFKSQFSNEANFNGVVDVPKWNSNKAYFNPYSIDISKYPNYNNIATKASSIVKFNILPNAFWDMFAPEVTFTFTSKATGKVLGTETAIVK